jgi:hypothetical protein
MNIIVDDINLNNLNIQDNNINDEAEERDAKQET